ncbi:MAG: serine protease [Candidatus Eremiobacteraeota bacterium]|nr:serine protease [Candidatus Eremiobacteraeota bacterium]
MAGLGVWGALEGAHMFHNARLGLLRYQKAQQDLFIDARLAEQARRVVASPALVASLRRETVMVVSRINARRSAVGSGVVLRNDRNGMLILTAKHIVRHRGPVSIVVSKQHYLPIPATRVVASPTEDLALVWTGSSDASVVPIRFAHRQLRTHERFIVMGHPGKRSWVATPGLAEEHLAYIFLYCPQCDNGDSGAGVFTTDGEVAGILVSKVFVDAPAIATGKRTRVVVFFMEPLERTRGFVNRIRAGRPVRKPVR